MVRIYIAYDKDYPKSLTVAKEKRGLKKIKKVLTI
jgi:hypothetical protein